MATWLNEELPEEWPSAGIETPALAVPVPAPGEASLHSHLGQTVAIQPSPAKTPQWKREMSPRRSQHGNVDDLVGLFEPESSESSAESQPTEDPRLQWKSPSRSQLTIHDTDPVRDEDTAGHFANSTTKFNETTETSEESTAPAPARRFHLYGQPNTYTNERIDGLLTSLQGHDSTRELEQPENSAAWHGNASRGPPAQANRQDSATAWRSSAAGPVQDFAGNYEQQGEQLLDRLRKNSRLELRSAPAGRDETSLDDLERKLAQPEPTTFDSTTLDTTTSGANGSTLSSLRSIRDSASETGSTQRWSLPPGLAASQSPGETNSLTTTASVPNIHSADDRKPGKFKASWSFSTAAKTEHSTQDDAGAGPYEPFSLSAEEMRENIKGLADKGSNRSKSAPAQQVSNVRFDAHKAPEVLQQRTRQHSRASVTEQDVHSLAIAGESGSDSYESHNLEARPSMATVRDRLSTEIFQRAADSTTSSSRAQAVDGPANTNTDQSTASFISVNEGSLSTGSVRMTPSSRPNAATTTRTNGTYLRSMLEKDGNRTSQGATQSAGVNEAFEISMKMPGGTPSRMEAPMPADLSTTSIGRKNTTFSGTLFELAKLVTEHKDLKRVKELNFAARNIETIVGLDRLVPNVEKLDLSNNDIKVLEGLPLSLSDLDLANNALDRLSTFPPSFITRLAVPHNELTDLRGLSQLRALTTLDISSNRLQSLRGIEQLPALEQLTLTGNSLVELNVSHLRLRVLHAGDNRIRAARIECPSLEDLNLDNNQLVTLQALPSLKRLSIRNNSTTVDLSGWASLEELYYDGNDVVRNMGKISPHILSWQGTELIGFDISALRHAQVAIMAGQGLRHLQLVQTVMPLQQLDLYNAGLESLPNWLPSKLPALAQLNLAFNRLNEESLSAISEFSALRKLSLYHNRFEDVGRVVEALSWLPYLGALDLRGNPVSDGCYPNISLDIEQPATEVYDDLLRSEWIKLDENWLRSTTDSSRARRRRYEDAFKRLGLWWLDGRETAEGAEDDRTWTNLATTVFAALQPTRILSTTGRIRSPAQVSAFGLSTPQPVGSKSLPRSTPSRPARHAQFAGNQSASIRLQPSSQRRPLKSHGVNVSGAGSNTSLAAAILGRTKLKFADTPRKLADTEVGDTPRSRIADKTERQENAYIRAVSDLVYLMCDVSYRKATFNEAGKLLAE